MTGKRRQKGEGGVYQRASDGRWVGVVELPSGGRRRRRYVYGKTAKEAARKLQQLRARLEAGQNVSKDRMTVGNWLDRWSGPDDAPGTGLIRDLAPNTVTSYTQIVRDYIRPELYRVRLLDLTPEHIRQMLDALAGRKPPVPKPTIAYSLRVLRIALTAAQKEDMIQRRNPAALVEPPKYRKRKAVPLGKKEAVSFLAAVQEDRLYALIVLMLTSALRRGEFLGLPWGNLVLDERYLWVRQQLQRQKGGGLIIRPITKTERSEAPVALANITVRALQTHRARLIEERLALGDAWRGRDDPVAPDALVFTSEIGTPLDPDNLRRRLHAFLKKANLLERGPHAAGRHTTATLLGALGVPPAVAAQVLRHSRTTTTLNVYTHVLTEDQRMAADKLDELLAGVFV